jgi:hypothetical protein
MLARLALVGALLSTATAAYAQSVHSRRAGVIGGDPDTLAADTREVDECIETPGIDEARRLEIAAEHYDRADVLFHQGDFEGAVVEFVAAYCHGRGAATTVLIDIAECYERLVNYEKAVAYMDRFVLAAPDELRDKRNFISYRVGVMRNLPAKIRVASIPPGAQVTLTGATGVAAQAEAGATAPIEVRKGAYEMKVELPGYEPITETVVAQIGQPYSYYFRLEPQTGSIRVFASPPDARIFIDKRLAAIGSHVETLPIGTYTVTVEAPDREPRSESVAVAAGRVADVRIALPQPARSGRTELIVAGTVGGTIFGAAALVSAMGDDSTVGSLGALGGAGIGFAGTYYGVRESTTVGTSSYVIGGTLIAATEGALIARLACKQGRCDDETVTGIALASGIAGLVFTTATAPRFSFDAGDAALLNSTATWGGATGALFWSVFDKDDRIGEPLVLVGLNAGILAGATLASRYEVSRGHVALVDLSGLAGIIAGVALASAFKEGDTGSDSERTQHFALGGMTVGLITGAYLTRGRDAPRSLGKATPTLATVHDLADRAVFTLGAGGRF